MSYVADPTVKSSWNTHSTSSKPLGFMMFFTALIKMQVEKQKKKISLNPFQQHSHPTQEL